MKKTLFISLCLFSALYGCGPKDNTVSYNEETGLTVCHYSNVKDTVDIKLSDLAEDFRIIKFDNSSEAIFNYRSTPTITEHYIEIAGSADLICCLILMVNSFAISEKSDRVPVNIL